jgi:hypothetical protein
VEHVRTLSKGVYQFEQQNLVSGLANCPCLQFSPEGIPSAGLELRCMAMLIEHQQFA